MGSNGSSERHGYVRSYYVELVGAPHELAAPREGFVITDLVFCGSQQRVTIEQEKETLLVVDSSAPVHLNSGVYITKPKFAVSSSSPQPLSVTICGYSGD